jgi:hypothetical protein
MTGSGSIQSLSLVLRGIEGLGLLFLVGVFITIGSCMRRTLPGKEQKRTRISPTGNRKK